jgi:dihydroorotate dehydrogenase (fumarate)
MNLSTNYLGLTLSSPLVIGASPFCDHVRSARRLQDAGAAALVMRSLFEEQLEPPPRVVRDQVLSESEASETFPEFADYQLAPEQYLRQLTRLKRELSIPVIASLNGHRPGGWVDFGKRLEKAGADAVELNFYEVVTDQSVQADQIETDILATVGDLAQSLKIPVAVKLSPFFTSLTQLVVGLELAGASGIVLFNRFNQPDVNIDEVEIQPRMLLSDSSELLLRLRWLAILAPELRGSLAATGGVHTAADMIKAILSGADVVQVVSAVLKHGPAVLGTLLQGLQRWMDLRGCVDIAQFRGLLDQRHCLNTGAFERANYIRTLQSWKVTA